MDDYELDKDELVDDHVRARPPWKTICAALSLLLVGIVRALLCLHLFVCASGVEGLTVHCKQGLFITSMNFYATSHDGATAFLVLSIIGE